MIRLAFVAAALLVVSPALAGDVHTFRIGGHSIRIEQPRDCNETSCLSIRIPGVYEQSGKRLRARDVENTKPVASLPAQTSRQIATATPVPETGLEPANGALKTLPAAAPNVPAEPPSVGLAPPKAAAPAPTAAIVAASPVGLWMTEEKKGKVRIEACGANLCGYAVDARSGAKGDTVLIDMKPGKDKWSGRIQDSDTGSTYESTIAMRSDDRLRVQGCAFGGMFCGGQTWTRAN